MKAISQGLAIPDDRCGEVSDLQCIYVSYRKRSDDPATQPLCCRIPLEGAGADTHQPSTSVIGTRSFAPSGVGCAGQAGSPTPPCVFLLHTCMLQSIPEYATTRLLFSHLCTAPSTGTHRHTHSSRVRSEGAAARPEVGRSTTQCVQTSLQHVTAALVKVRLVQPVLLGHERREHVRARLLEVG